MQLPSRLRLGCVEYLNARPLIDGWPGEVRFDSPAALSELLRAGQLDIALVPSFEYLRNPIYAIVNDLAIASEGPVYSVFLAYPGELEAVREIEIDPASQTSVNLLRCLLAEFYGIHPRFETESGRPVEGTTARLVIGNQAIRFRQSAERPCRYLDLGEAWTQWTSLPFVYALWLARPEFADSLAVANGLRAQLALNLARIDQIAATQRMFDPVFAAFYLGACLRFTFGPREKLGLMRFAEMCVKHRLLGGLPAGWTLV